MWNRDTIQCPSHHPTPHYDPRTIIWCLKVDIKKNHTPLYNFNITVLWKLQIYPHCFVPSRAAMKQPLCLQRSQIHCRDFTETLCAKTRPLHLCMEVIYWVILIHLINSDINAWNTNTHKRNWSCNVFSVSVCTHVAFTVNLHFFQWLSRLFIWSHFKTQLTFTWLRIDFTPVFCVCVAIWPFSSSCPAPSAALRRRSAWDPQNGSSACS